MQQNNLNIYRSDQRFKCFKKKSFTIFSFFKNINYAIHQLERPFSKLLFSDTSLWNQHKHIVFNIFSYRILTISYKMLIITVISNKTRKELTIYATLCRNVTIFYRRELASLFQAQEKLKTCRNSK